MKKKLLTTLSAILCVLACALAFVACNGGGNDSGHDTNQDGSYTIVAGRTYVFDYVNKVDYAFGEDYDAEYIESIKERYTVLMSNRKITFNGDGTFEMYNPLWYYDDIGTYTQDKANVSATIGDVELKITVSAKSITVFMLDGDISITMTFTEGTIEKPDPPMPDDPIIGNGHEKCEYRDMVHIVAVQDSTCANAGYIVDIYWCGKCGKVFRDINAIDMNESLGVLDLNESTPVEDYLEIDYETGKYKYKASYFKKYGSTPLPLPDHPHEIIPAVTATCVIEGFTEGRMCRICNVMAKEPQSLGYTQHNFIDDWYNECGYMCQGCGRLRDKDIRFRFSLNDDGESYTLRQIDYNVTDTELTIPRRFNGKPVTKLRGDDAGRVTLSIFGWDNISIEKIIIPDDIISIDFATFFNCKSLTSIVIPNSVTIIGDDAFYNCRGLTSITIPNSVKSIGDSAFYGCSGLTSIEIPNSVTSIGSSAFYGCNNIKTATLPTNILPNIPTSKLQKVVINGGISIGNRAFYYCSDLISIEIPNSVTSIGNSAFSACSSLTSIEIPNSVKSIGDSAFYGCSGLTSIEIPNSVTSIGNSAFSDCRGLTSITIPNSVTSIGNSAFYGCSSLTSITIPNSVTSIGNSAFYGCSSLTSITIPNSVKSIRDGAFYNCSGLTSIEIPNSVTSIGNGAFNGCSGLTSIEIPNSVTSIGNGAFNGCSGLTSITYMGDIKSWCEIDGLSNLMYYGSNKTLIIDGKELSGKLVIPDGVTGIVEYAFKGCRGLTSIEIPNSVKSIGNRAFEGCSSLTSITYMGDIKSWCEIDGLSNLMYYGSSNKTLIIDGKELSGRLVIPDGVTGIVEYAFRGCCSGLTSIEIPDSVTSIGSDAFYGCSNLSSITYMGDIKSWCEIDGLSNLMYYGSNKILIIDGKELSGKLVIPDGVTSIRDGAFSGCSGLTSIEIPNSVTSIRFGAFYYCSGLTSISIPNSVTSIGNRAFEGCSSLTSITYMGDIKSWCEIDGLYNLMRYGSSNKTLIIDGKELSGRLVIPDSVTSIVEYAFRGCRGLTSIDIPNSVTSIGEYAFFGCSSLTSITIPNSVTSIGEYAFFGCSSLMSITIPNSVTSIEKYAFYNCSSLTSITIPNSVTSIEEYAFSGCSGLTSITFNGTLSQWNAISKGVSWNTGTSYYTITCTDGTISKSGNLIENS